MSLEENKKQITKLQMKLYYIEHRTTVNKNRKKYKRQSWDERKDNPKNKENKIAI